MRIGIVGLGLIGGSLAKAYKNAGAEVLAYNRSGMTKDYAELSGAVDGELDAESMRSCDTIFICITIDAAIAWLKENAENFGSESLVIDCCGIKRRICDTGFKLAEEQGFTFIGGHPMAGKQYGGFKNSSGDLFKGATMIFVSKERNDIKLLERLKKLFKMAGFAKLSFMTAEQHDEMIAFTSQMTHIAANAFVKNEQKYPEGFPEGGSFRDFTRVADLDEDMWTELFLENKDNVLKELDDYIGELEKYRDAIESEEDEKLKQLLQEGSISKRTADEKDPVFTMEL